MENSQHSQNSINSQNSQNSGSYYEIGHHGQLDNGTESGATTPNPELMQESSCSPGLAAINLNGDTASYQNVKECREQAGELARVTRFDSYIIFLLKFISIQINLQQNLIK